MISNVPVILENVLVDEVKKILNRDIADFSTINYIYIVNQRGRLLGAVSIKNFFGPKQNLKVKDLIKSRVARVSPETDQEQVAMLALKKNLKAIPVVAGNGRLLGVVPNDVIMNILHEESVENLLRLSGVNQEESYEDNGLSLSLFKSLKNRLPWLIVGLLGGLFIAFIVSNFESVLSKHIVLASFIPLVVYMSSAVGSQAQSFIIRDLALNKDLNFIPYLIRHTRVVVMIALIISPLLCFISFFLYGVYAVSLVLALSLFLSILTSIISGLIIPYIFFRLKLDPADASGPIATILQDILSTVTYFSVAYFLL